jgi:glycosyltransferase involved in cell wall biosynthesis
VQTRNPAQPDSVSDREAPLRSWVSVERTTSPRGLAVLPFRSAMAPTLELSAVICTLDRGPDIALSVDSLLAQDLPAEAFEILLVDNGSAPASTSVLRDLAAAHPDRVRYVREERVGESSARNCSLAHARGAVLAYLDDDAIADPGWLRAYRDAFAADPGLGVAGGPIRLRYLVDKPSWVDAQMETWLSGFDRAAEPHELRYPEFPRGANMAYRRSEFDDGTRFSEDFGRKGKCLLSHSEIELIYRLSEKGTRVGFVPGAGVDHLVPGGRLDRKWFALRSHWQGRSEVLFDRVHRGRLALLARLPRHVAGWLRKCDLRRHYHAGYLAGALGALRHRGA